MKSSKGIKFFVFIIINVLIILLPNYSYSIQKNEKTPKQVIIGGELLHLELNTNKVMFFGIKNNFKIKDYDLVNSVSGEVVKRIFYKEEIQIKHKEELISLLISMKENDKLKLKLLRNNKVIITQLNKNEINPNNLIDKIPYTATLTYTDPYTYKYKAVGHSIDCNNNKDIISNSGNIYNSNIDIINKSKKNCVGNISGKKLNTIKGSISKNSEYGISGYINENYKNEKIYTVANKNDLKLGYAYIVMKHNVNKENQYYKININKINKNYNGEIESFKFSIVDKNLIKSYGGITQGMSGSPIVQNKKIIGALSHVITTDTSMGIGIYIEVMMKE